MYMRKTVTALHALIYKFDTYLIPARRYIVLRRIMQEALDNHVVTDAQSPSQQDSGRSRRKKGVNQPHQRTLGL